MHADSLTDAIEIKFSVYNTLNSLLTRTKYCRTMQTSTQPIFKRIKPFALSFALCLIAVNQTGCSYLEPYKAGVTQGNILTEESVGLLQEGLTKDQVRQLIGPPMGENPFNPNHWEYVYFSTADGQALSEVNKHIIVEFGDDQLVTNWSTKEIFVKLKKEEPKYFFGFF